MQANAGETLFNAASVMICAVTMESFTKASKQCKHNKTVMEAETEESNITSVRSHITLCTVCSALHCVVCHITHFTLHIHPSHITHPTLHITDHTSHITRWGPHRKSTKARAGRVLCGSPARKSNPAPPPADFYNSAQLSITLPSFPSTPSSPHLQLGAKEGWWGMLEAKHSANS